MILSRYLGALVAVIITVIFAPKVSQDLIIQVPFWLFAALVGLILSVSFSMMLGIGGFEDRPLPQDSLDYWLEYYDDDRELAERAHKYWMQSR